MIKRIAHSILSAYYLLAGSAAVAAVSFTHLASQPPDNIVSIVNDTTSNDIYAAASLTAIRSVDQGATWQKTANTGALNLNTLYVTASGQLYAGVDKSNAAPNVGLVKYNKASNTWSSVAGAPLDVTAIIEDNAGNLIVGTGSTGNFGVANPINKGAGLHAYVVATGVWSAINTGVPNVPGYAVLPFIKAFAKTSAGLVVAATYGNGVLQWNGAAWSTYGTGLANPFVNSLAITTTSTVLAGTDNGVSAVTNATSAWTSVSTGLPPNKPIRTLAINASGTIFAGLGFYHFQNGNMAGDIYSSANNGASWQTASNGYVGGVIYTMLAHPSGNLLMGAAGIWQSANSGGQWTYSMAGVSLANQTVQIAKNSSGTIFVMCRNNLLATRLPYAGIFRSDDNGFSWQQIVNGLKTQNMTAMHIDSQDHIWVAGNTIQPNAPGTGTLYGNPELYKSIDNGNTWVRNTSIVQASNGYHYIQESKAGKLFVASAFGTGQSNISSTTDFNTFDNTLNLPPTNGFHAYGLAVNNAGDVFLGTETNGIMRSTNAGNAGTFVSITTGDSNPQPIPGPVGNVGVGVDPYTQTVFGTGTHGSTAAINMYGSTAANNGTSMYPFLNFPAPFGGAGNFVFANTGKMYMTVQSGTFSQVGLYEAQGPFDTNTTFTQAISFGTLSYYFDTLFKDKCGYLYGTGANSGINISNGHVDSASKSTLTLPAAGATGVSSSPLLIWSADCVADSFHMQISTVPDLSSVLVDFPLLGANGIQFPAGVLSNNITYYWRVQSTNNLGVAPWSDVSSFTTSAVVTAPVSLIGVSSRKVHGAVGPFDLPIDTTQAIGGAVTVEPRAIGSGHTIVFKFDGAIASPGSAFVVPVGTALASFLGNEVRVALTNVPDNQRVTIALVNVNGGVTPPAVSMGFLIGDVNNTRAIGSSDVSAVKARSGQPASALNFQFDLNATGAITAADIAAAKARSGNILQ
jgi:hypothetical protein